MRDGRPLTYLGRFVVPSHVDAKDSIWGITPLMKWKRTTSDLPQLPARGMRKVEDVSANALPSSTDDQSYVQGAYKYEQLGQQCMGMIFDYMFTDMSVQNKLAILIVDFRTTVGDGLLAFFDKRRSYNMPMYYCGFCEDSTELEWAKDLVTKELAKRILDGTMVPTGFKLQSEEIPAD